MRTRIALLAVAGSALLGGCADYGYGYGPYSSLSVGVGYGGGYGGYYSPYDYGYGYSPFDYGGWYGDPYFGWYDGGYYPGSGIYVYDSYRRPHRWNDQQQRYWRDRQQSVTTRAVSSSRQQPQFNENWSGFNRRSEGSRSSTTTNSDYRGRHGH